MKSLIKLAAALVSIAAIAGPTARGDMVTDWNLHLEEAVVATAMPVPAQSRTAAIVHVAIFDAVNGIERQYHPFHVTAASPPGARAEAAAAQAAYTTLLALFPSRAEILEEQLAESLARIPGHQGRSRAIARGRAWGEFVANQILELRSQDRWNEPQPPFMGGFAIGQWRSLPTGGNPDGTLPAVFPQNAVLAPFVMSHPAQFRPGPPYGAPIPEALLTPAYAADLAEVQLVGRVDSPVRTAEQTEIALLWQAMGCIDENRAARSVVPSGAGLVDTARLFALLNMAAADALIIGWDSKFAHQLWRPHHAIRLADTDGNPDTMADPGWSGLILAPRFPEYVSNHSTLTSAMMRVLERELGDEHTFTLSSPHRPGFSQTYSRFSDAAAQAVEARIWGGIHFRHACEVGGRLGVQLADFTVENCLRPLRKR